MIAKARASLEQIAQMSQRCEVQDANTVAAWMRTRTLDTWRRVPGERDLYELVSSVAFPS